MKFLHFNTKDVVSDAPLKIKKKFQSRTVAAEPFTASVIRVLAESYLNSNDLSVGLNVGVTFCSLKQNYCKDEGRKEALKKQHKQTLKVDGVTINDTHIFIHLQPYLGVQMNLRLNKSTGFSTVTGQLTDQEERNG